MPRNPSVTFRDLHHAHRTHRVAYGRSSRRAFAIDPPQDVHIP
jgi:hypothetical protein